MGDIGRTGRRLTLLALMGLVADVGGGYELLRRTAYEPPARYREPEVLFVLDGSATLDGWETEGYETNL